MGVIHANSVDEACCIAGVDRSSVSPTSSRAVVLGDRPSKKNASVRWHSDGRGGSICNWKGTEPVIVVWREPPLINERPQYNLANNMEHNSSKAVNAAIQQIWKVADKVQSHPYLVAKCLEPVSTLKVLAADQICKIFSDFGLKNGRGYPLTLWHGDGPMAGPILIVPVLRGREWKTVQFIDGDGHKLMMKDAKFHGGYWCTRSTQEIVGQPLIFIAEGVATAMSIDAVHHVPCVAALSCNNLKNVAQYFKKIGGNSKIVMVADNDLSGVGLKCANEAALG